MGIRLADVQTNAGSVAAQSHTHTRAWPLGTADNGGDPTRRAAEQLDAVLTPFGLEQCGALAKLTAGLAGVELLVTSPLRRCVQTALHGFQPHIDRGVPLIALESVRETVNFTCDRR